MVSVYLQAVHPLIACAWRRPLPLPYLCLPKALPWLTPFFLWNDFFLHPASWHMSLLPFHSQSDTTYIIWFPWLNAVSSLWTHNVLFSLLCRPPSDNNFASIVAESRVVPIFHFSAPWTLIINQPNQSVHTWYCLNQKETLTVTPFVFALLSLL